MAIKYRFSVQEFERLHAEVKHVELLEGEIYQMSPVGPIHVRTINYLTGLFAVMLLGKVIVSVQNPIRLSNYSEPEPDIALLKLEYNSEQLPSAPDILLVVEVSDSTLKYDREQKLPIYAEAGISEYWIVNLIDNVLEVYREPIGRMYRTRRLYQPGEAVEFMGERLEVI